MNELNFILAIFLKPSVLFLDDLLLIPLWEKKNLSGVKFMMVSIILFFIGEIQCAIDVYLLRRMTDINESGHDIFMMLAFSFFFLGAYHLLRKDSSCWRIICPMFEKNERDAAVKCTNFLYFNRLGAITILFLSFIALLPIFASSGVLKINLDAGLLGHKFATYIYNRTEFLSFLQQKIFPVISFCLLFSSGIVYLIVKRLNRFLIWVSCFGLGAFAFTYFRLFLVHVFYPNAAFTAFWEEVLELMFIAFIFLWLKIRGDSK